MNFVPARIGDAVTEIDTPALIVDLDAFERNMKKMAAFADLAGIRLRPHAKTHRCAAIALKQRHSCKAEYGIFSSATRYWTSASFAGWLRWRKAPPFPFVSMRSNKWMPPRKLRRSLKSSLEHWWKSTWECGDAVSCRETLRRRWPNISKRPPA